MHILKQSSSHIQSSHHKPSPQPFNALVHELCAFVNLTWDQSPWRMVLIIQFPRDSLSVPAVPHLQGTSSFIMAIYAPMHRCRDHDTLGYSFSYSQDFIHSPCIKTFQRSQLGFQSQVYLHLVNLYDKQITIKKEGFLP